MTLCLFLFLCLWSFYCACVCVYPETHILTKKMAIS
jgi:hypothetical protein